MVACGLSAASSPPRVPILSELSVQESPTEQIIANNLILMGLHLLDIPLRRRLMLAE